MTKPSVVALCLCASVAFLSLCVAAQAKEVVTYSKQVAPILFKNCTSCHRPGAIAPMSLMSYKDARPWAKSIREKVAERAMPPWLADPRYGKFYNDRRLSQQEMDTIVAWVDGGAREGNPKELPPPPAYVEGWNIGKPDVVFSMPEEFDVPAQGVVEYQHFTMPSNFTEDRWVRAAEIRPGNRGVVHHIIVFIQEPGSAVRPPSGIQILNPNPAIPPPPPNPRNRVRLGTMLVGTAPGEPASISRPGTARLVKAGSNLLFQVHYTPNGKAVRDRSSVGLVFAKEPPQYVVRTVPVLNGRFVLPPGEPSHKVESAALFTEDVHIRGLFPHMHLRGKSFEYRLVYSDGRSEIILSVPKYDFNWQSGYSFAEPIPVPKGTRLECTAYFDNSKRNKYNPDPTKEVRWGDQTWEEMMIGWTSYTVDNQKAVASSQ